MCRIAIGLIELYILNFDHISRSRDRKSKNLERYNRAEYCLVLSYEVSNSFLLL